MRENNMHADDREASPGQLDPWLRLAAGIVSVAARDARAGDISAARWLQEPAGVAELAAGQLDLDFSLICRQARKWEKAAVEAARERGWRIRIYTQEVDCEQPGSPII